MRAFVLFLSLFNLSVVNAKALVIGIPPYIPPFVMELDNKGQYIGFDIDIMNEICRRIEQQCEYQAYNYDQVINGVLDGSLDLGIGDITITTDRAQQFIFSLPYMESAAQYVTLKTSGINLPADIKGKRIGLQHPELFEPLVLKQFSSDITITPYHYISDMVVALTAGDVDVIIMDAAAAESLYANNSNLMLVGDKMPVGLGYGIVSAKNNDNLMYKINSALVAMEADGTYLNIYNIYFGDMKY